jgi:predicted Zn-dependent protease
VEDLVEDLVEEPPEPVGRTFRARSRDHASAAGLNEELGLLDQARAAIRQGRPNEALARLDEHSTRFPKGALSLEAQVLRVQGLAAAGRTEEASRRAKRILSRSPNSVVAQRLRQYVIE